MFTPDDELQEQLAKIVQKKKNTEQGVYPKEDASTEEMLAALMAEREKNKKLDDENPLANLARVFLGGSK